jgi:hypothetical protein
MRLSSQKLYDHISPFEEFMRLFDSHRDNMLTAGTVGQFKLKLVFAIVFLILFKFAFDSIMPTVVNIVLLAAVIFLIVEAILGFFRWMNGSAQRSGVFGIAKCLIGLVVIAFLL